MRNGLFLIIVLVILFALFDRGARVHLGYPGSIGGLIVLILVLGFIFRWF